MPGPAPTRLCEPAAELLAAYLAWLAASGRDSRAYTSGARSFLARWPNPQAWAAEPLGVRLGAGSNTWPLLNFLMLHGHLRPGYDYLLERKLHALGRELAASPLGPELDRFIAAAAELGYSQRARLGMASQVAARLRIQIGRPLTGLVQADLDAFGAAIAEREQRHGRAFKHCATRSTPPARSSTTSAARSSRPPRTPPASGAGRPILTACPPRCAPAADRLPGMLCRHPHPLDGVAHGQPPGPLRPLPGRP